MRVRSRPNDVSAFAKLLGLAAFALSLPALATGTANAATIGVTVTVIGSVSSQPFASPTVRFSHTSDTGYLITTTNMTGAFADYVQSSLVVAPAGGTVSALGTTQIANSNVNDGCNALNFGLTSFNPGDFFQHAFDPENNACANVVFDFRPRLNANAVGVAVVFTGPGITGSLTLSGSTWIKDLINNALPSSQSNDRYTLTLGQTINLEEPPPSPPTNAPEPVSLALLGVGLAGVAIARRARRNREPG